MVPSVAHRFVVVLISSIGWQTHALFLFGGAIGVGLLPVTLQNWVGGPILSMFSQAMANRVFKKSRPIVKERLEKTDKLKADPDYDWTPPEDALQWLIDECYASPNPEEQLVLKRVCCYSNPLRPNRLLILNDVSLLITAYTCQNLLLDLFSTDPRLGYVEALRDECARALAESGGTWDHTAVKKLRLVDSAIRESMRLNPFGSVLLPRRVVHPQGIEALRGGGNNLGVVTRFDLRAFPQGPFWGGAVLYFPPSFSGQAEALVSELNKPGATDETHLVLSIGYSASYMQLGGTLCMNHVYHTGEGVTAPEVLDPFVKVSPQVDQLNSMRSLTLKDSAGEQASQSADGVRCAYMNTTVKADAATLNAASEAYLAALEPLKGCEGIPCSLTLQPYSASLLRKSEALGGNGLGLSAEDGPHVSILALTWWKDKGDDEKIVGTFRKVVESIDQDARSRGTAVPFKYMNYAWDFQDPISSSGEKNKALLQEVSRKYDPDLVFQKCVPGGFKLL
ncbi:hypothetical protein INS49_014235 [Diaporthe citri]|uniref:uncharacterized protein n=1 Tax=Diaporthe citri TaxID=83186 RepID=UPI001C7F405B|nr:uncharacterized protein INS49_014235 [Diaporthe citri]KAG6358351.1 hypothetical protein INS49_014235 [Diaporthe citri]